MAAGGGLGETGGHLNKSHTTRAVFPTSLRLRDEVSHLKSDGTPAGLLWARILAEYENDQKLPLADRYIHQIRMEGDITFKRTNGEMNEWESAIWYPPTLEHGVLGSTIAHATWPDTVLSSAFFVVSSLPSANLTNPLLTTAVPPYGSTGMPLSSEQACLRSGQPDRGMLQTARNKACVRTRNIPLFQRRFLNIRLIFPLFDTGTHFYLFSLPTRRTVLILHSDFGQRQSPSIPRKLDIRSLNSPVLVGSISVKDVSLDSEGAVDLVKRKRRMRPSFRVKVSIMIFYQGRQSEAKPRGQHGMLTRRDLNAHRKIGIFASADNVAESAGNQSC
ncbi:hypothetical protein B0H14DRAFT_2578653 [Mycena olivaceomarginata]|nr:hypothetical protein B0H14DRAFT_2578653 [Mycena olivaceomarginata]